MGLQSALAWLRRLSTSRAEELRSIERGTSPGITCRAHECDRLHRVGMGAKRLAPIPTSVCMVHEVSTRDAALE